MISDAFLDEHKDETGNEIDCFMLTPSAAFEHVNVPKKGPAGIFLSRAVSINAGTTNSALDYSAAYAAINGKEVDDPEPMTQYFALQIMHPQRFRYIYPRHTTARGIILHQ
jgi:hypothetical protein